MTGHGKPILHVFLSKISGYIQIVVAQVHDAPRSRTRTSKNPYGTETNAAGWRGNKVTKVFVYLVCLFVQSLLTFRCFYYSPAPYAFENIHPHFRPFRLRSFIAHHESWFWPALRCMVLSIMTRNPDLRTLPFSGHRALPRVLSTIRLEILSSLSLSWTTSVLPICNILP